MKIVFVRHGQTDWNAQNLVQGQTNISLNDIGRQQARDVAKKLAIEYDSFDVVFASTLSRAKETAKIINEHFKVPLVFDERIFEQCFGSLEGADRRTLIGGSVGTHMLAIGEKACCELGAETFEHMSARVVGFIEQVAEKHADKTVLVVTHQGVCRVVKWHFDGVEGNEKFFLNNGEILEYVV